MCNLRCVFCQNWDISQKKNGWELKVKISVSDPDSLIPDQGFLLNQDPDPGFYDLT
jgi:pyruvate-formate lyase-activating enzyme